MLFPTSNKKLVPFFLEKQFFLISIRVLCYFQHTKKLEILKSPPSLVKWKVVSPNRDSGNLYPIYPLFPCSDFYLKCGGSLGWGGGLFFFHFRLFPTFIETKIKF